ncbi:MAG: hypothetical protein ACRET8_06980 [Burkholderiales bacterium]
MSTEHRFLTRSWTVAKYAAAILLLLVVVVAGIGIYTKRTRDEAKRNSPFVQKLEQTEREKGNVLKLLFEGLKDVSEDDARLTVSWLLARQTRGEMPYLYLAGLYSGKSSEDARRMRGLEYLAEGMLVYRVDALRCNDTTAPQAIPAFEGTIGLKTIRDSVRTDTELRRTLVARALEYEEKTKNRQRPAWICARGTKPEPPVSEERMEFDRKAIRTQFEESF